MKTIIPFFCLLAIWSCNGGSKTNAAADSTPVKPDSTIAAVAPAPLKDTAPEAFVSPLRKKEILIKGRVYTDSLSYVGYNDNGDDELFICVKGKDTVALICNNGKAPVLNNGDRIVLQWKMDIYEPAGDPEFPYPAEYVVDYHLVAPGKLTLLKKSYDLLQGHYDDKEVSPEGQTEIDAAVWYYVANTTDTAIRNVVDVERKVLQYTIEKNEGSVSNIIFKTATQPVLKRVLFNAEQPYSLSE
ncbi:hypothetical protein [Chitinophaga sp.]|uniref:hypothetical protein n=1 Tax=Chitinophaga sp. TaxID=1869181 RepID=UPI002F941BF5